MSDFHARYGPTAVITGAARGIGAGYARRLARAGFEIVLTDIDADGLERTAAALRDDGRVRVDTLALDMTDLDAIPRLAELTVDREIGNAERGLAAASTRTRTRDPERTARTLASLVKTLSELKRLQPNETASAPQVEDDEIDIDEYRRDLARRLDQLAIEEADGEDTRRTAAR